MEEPAEAGDNTEANANMDFTAHQEMLKELTTALPVTDEDVTLTYFMGFESNSLNYMEGGDLMNHQVWTWLRENTGVTIDLRVVDKTQQTDQFNLMLASGDYTDLMNVADYSAGTEAAYEEDIIIDLTDYIEEFMPNYNQIIHSDQNVLGEVLDGGMILRALSHQRSDCQPLRHWYLRPYGLAEGSEHGGPPDLRRVDGGSPGL